MCVCVCVCDRERESVCVCVFVSAGKLDLNIAAVWNECVDEKAVFDFWF